MGAAAQTETFVHSFSNNNIDGNLPLYGGLVSDAVGNLYGTTALGGAISAVVVYELSPRAGGGWSERVLYSFTGTGGRNPEGALTFDAVGNLYGTTAAGGANNNSGTVFELSPKAGAWTEKVLYNFGAYSTDGQFLYAGVTLHSPGHVYPLTGTRHLCPSEQVRGGGGSRSGRGSSCRRRAGPGPRQPCIPSLPGPEVTAIFPMA